ncbi:MAG: hypothetical protein NWE89_04875 [Candidatus Bathyarchaeota archaeon]|nr:hypothetical protein [Candidatus Bathyarchaeota archaeon]
MSKLTMQESRFRLNIFKHYLPFITSISLTVFTLIFDVNSNLLLSIIYGVFLFIIPGFYITHKLKSMFELEIDEFIVFDIVISGAFITFLFLCLTQLFQSVTRFTVLASITLFLAITGATTQYPSHKPKDNKQITVILFPLLISFLLGIVVNSFYATTEFWRGCDGWETVSIFRGISELSLSYLQAFDYFQSYVILANSGFYHLLAIFHLVTGFLPDAIMRYGGLIQSGLFTALTYVVVKRSMGVVPGLVGVFFVSLNPFLNFRLMLPFRENFAIFYLITSITLVTVPNTTKRDYSFSRVGVFALLMAACLVTHPMTPVFLYAVFFFQAIISFLINNKPRMWEIFTAIILSLLISFPFITKMVIPITHMIQKSTGSSLLIATSLTMVIIVSSYLLSRQKVLYDLIPNQAFHFLLGIVIIFIVLINIFFPPDLNGVFNFNNMALENFSKTLIPFSMIGLIALLLNPGNKNIKFLTVLLVFTIIPSYFGVPVPLRRIGVYLSWLMSYFAAYLIKNSENDLSLKLDLYDNKKTLMNLFNLFKDNKHTFLLIFIIMISGVRELSVIRRPKITLTSDDIANTAEFIENLEPNDIVLPYVLSEHLLYYNGAPRENLITNVSKEIKLKQIFNISSPYEISRLVEENFPEKTRLIIYVARSFELELFQKQCAKAITSYFTYVSYGSFVSYSLDIPFTLENIELNKVKYIADSSPSPVINSENEFGWDSEITTISNIIYNPDDPQKQYMIYYIATDSSNNQHLGLSFSRNGLIWDKYPEPLMFFEFDTISLVNHENRFYLYAIGESKDTIYRFMSVDGLKWGNETIIFDSSLNEELWVFESPIVWIENGTWNMIFWGTFIGEQFGSSLFHASSVDGVKWESLQTLNWVILDNTYRMYSRDKILLNDIIKLDTGYLFLGRVHLKGLDMSTKWRSGSIYVGNITDYNAYLTCFVYKNHLNLPDAVDYAYLFPQNGVTVPEFLYFDADGFIKGVYRGAVSDHLGVPEDFIVKP